MSSPKQLSPANGYLGILGLEREPFLDQVDDRFFYADPALVQRLDLLQHLTRFGDMLLGVVGPSGSGKSTLLRQFLLRGDSGWRRCTIQGAQTADPNELLTRLAECLGQNPNAAPDRLRADLLRYLQLMQHNAQQVVVVIDDAQLLPEAALKGLLELAGDARQTLKLLRVVLFGDTGLEQKLVQAGLHSPQQPLLHNLELPRFDERQTAAYLMYRLAVAGYSGDSPFSLTEIRALHKTADGVPGRLNILAHEALIERAGRVAARKPRPAPPETGTHTRQRIGVVFASVVGVLLVAFTGWYLSLSHWPRDRSEQPIVAQAPALPAQDGVDASVPSATLTQERDATENLELALSGEIPAENQEVSPGEPAPATQGVGGPDGSATAGDAEPRENEPFPTPLDTGPEQPRAVRGTQTPAPSRAPAETVERSEPAASEPYEAGSDVRAEPPQETTAKRTGDPVPAPGPVAVQRQAPAAPVETPPPPPEISGEGALEREAWLLERPADHFALQLLGVRNEEALRDYAARQRLPSPIAYFRTQYKGGDWFVLVQGDYPTMAAARAAVATLPPAVRKDKPWPRSFAALQADIGKAAP